MEMISREQVGQNWTLLNHTVSLWQYILFYFIKTI